MTEIDLLKEHHIPTPAERLMLSGVADGLQNAEIAQEASITEGSVRGTLERFRNRTGLAGRALVSWAVRHRGCCLRD